MSCPPSPSPVLEESWPCGDKSQGCRLNVRTPQNPRVETLSLPRVETLSLDVMSEERPLGGDVGLHVEPREGDRGPYRGPREPPAPGRRHQPDPEEGPPGTPLDLVWTPSLRSSEPCSSVHELPSLRYSLQRRTCTKTP
ncbi:unnamed protein product [Rangifer tarandus platyrhynchus]|uniref:Uncharacterized protein n=3 Tax=Rangifer tarandus platyrhynchus TaxID=3082113 RepID=A0ABN8Z0H5_RANTA|nr:unnamed protein product [Rangifer tarandus platyrhynchus]CAI9704942.1 unnamed protein product [Rangifer tarandus platyrhynchus]